MSGQRLCQVCPGLRGLGGERFHSHGRHGIGASSRRVGRKYIVSGFLMLEKQFGFVVRQSS